MKKLYYDRNNRSFARVVPLYTDEVKVRAVNKKKKYVEVESSTKKIQYKATFVKSEILDMNGTRDYIISSRYNPTPFLIFTAIYMILLIVVVLSFETKTALSLLLVLLAINLKFGNDFKLIKNQIEIRPITNKERTRIENEK